MSTLSKAQPATTRLSVSDLTRLAPAPSSGIASRDRLRSTSLLANRGVVKVRTEETDDLRPSIVTRRNKMLKQRRRKRVLIGVALVLALFPPVWAIYLIAWLVWRSRPPQQSMRRVKKAVRDLEKSRAGVAMKKLQEAHLLDPSNTDALYWLGLLLYQQERTDEAEEALSIVAERVPGLPEVEGVLAQTYIALGQAQNAVYHAQRLVDIAPYDPKSLVVLSEAFEAAGDLDLARSTLEQAPLGKRTLNEGLLQVHYRLGDLSERHGDLPHALDHFKRAYAHDISYRDVKKRVERIQSQLDARSDSGPASAEQMPTKSSEAAS